MSSASTKGVSFKVAFDDGRVGQALAAALRRGQNLKPAHDDIGLSMVVATQQRFERETGPDGLKWPASIRAKAQGGKTLTDTARLKNSLAHMATSSSLTWGTNVIYAAIHQLGGTIKQPARQARLLFAGGRFVSRASARRRKSGAIGFSNATIGARSITMPARPYLGLDEDDGNTAIRAYESYLGAPLLGGALPGGAA